MLNQLDIAKADIAGLSLGAAVGLRTAIQHPEKVRRLVVISSPYSKSGWYPETQEGMGQVSAAMAEQMMQTPTGQFSKQWPEPQRFPLADRADYPFEERVVVLGRREHAAQLVRRDDLQPGAAVRGPAIVVEQTATTVVPPGSEARVDELGTLVIDVGGEG